MSELEWLAAFVAGLLVGQWVEKRRNRQEIAAAYVAAMKKFHLWVMAEDAKSGRVGTGIS